MKKFLLVIVAMFCVATVSAQSKLAQSAAPAAKWSLGLRAGLNAGLVAEYFYGQDTYIDGRLGVGYLGGNVTVEFDAYHNWNLYNWDWTPNAGSWYLDSGVGAFVGGMANRIHFGVAATVKFGIHFKKVPIRLALDVSPQLGVDVNSPKTDNKFSFYDGVPVEVGLSAAWCF